MTRFQAFTKHFLLSAVIVGTACAVIWYAWYPAPLFEFVGAWSAVQVLIGVDLIVGPVMTLILYKAGKRWLWLDMTVIAIIQLTAFGYGMSVIYQERPCYMVFAVDRFELVTCSMIDPQLLKSNEAIGPKDWRSPLYAVANFPSDQNEFQKLQEEVIFEGAPDIALRPNLWSTYDENISKQLSAVAIPAASLSLTDEMRKEYSDIEARIDKEPWLIAATTMKGQVITLAIDPDTLRPMGHLPINPWENM